LEEQKAKAAAIKSSSVEEELNVQRAAAVARRIVQIKVPTTATYVRIIISFVMLIYFNKVISLSSTVQVHYLIYRILYNHGFIISAENLCFCKAECKTGWKSWANNTPR